MSAITIKTVSEFKTAALKALDAELENLTIKDSLHM